MRWFVLFLLLFSGCASDSGYMSVAFFDVGQGDSALLVTPDSKKILIDCGEGAEASEYLQLLNITYIDVLIITHPDIDHSGGCDEVMKTAAVGRVITNKNTRRDFNLQISRRAKLEVFVAYDTAGKSRNDNDNSVMLKASYDGVSFLFTGDCGSECEEEIMKTALIEADVLKVSHHGSAYSTSEQFIEKVKPSLAIISVGENSYGHPSNKTLSRLRNAGAKVMRTDLNRTVVVIASNKTYRIA